MLPPSHRSSCLFLAAALAACNQPPATGHGPPAPPRVAPVPPPAADVASPPPAAADAAPAADAADAASGPDAAQVAVVRPAAPIAPAGPPRQVVQVPGLRIVLLHNGQIEMHGTDLWGAPINSTFQDCTYYRNALPTVRRTLPPAQAAVLGRMCAGAAP